MTEEDKKPFEELAAADKARYEKEMADPDMEMQEATNAKDAKSKDKNIKTVYMLNGEKIKKPMAAYMHFTGTKREEIVAETNKARAEAEPKEAELKQSEIMALLGEKWRELTDEGKQPFEALAVADKARYEKEMETADVVEIDLKKEKEAKEAEAEAKKAAKAQAALAKKKQEQGAGMAKIGSFFMAGPPKGKAGTDGEGASSSPAKKACPADPFAAFNKKLEVKAQKCEKALIATKKVEEEIHADEAAEEDAFRAGDDAEMEEKEESRSKAGAQKNQWANSAFAAFEKKRGPSHAANDGAEAAAGSGSKRKAAPARRSKAAPKKQKQAKKAGGKKKKKVVDSESEAESSAEEEAEESPAEESEEEAEEEAGSDAEEAPSGRSARPARSCKTKGRLQRKQQADSDEDDDEEEADVEMQTEEKGGAPPSASAPPADETDEQWMARMSADGAKEGVAAALAGAMPDWSEHLAMFMTHELGEMAAVVEGMEEAMGAEEVGSEMRTALAFIVICAKDAVRHREAKPVVLESDEEWTARWQAKGVQEGSAVAAALAGAMPDWGDYLGMFLSTPAEEMPDVVSNMETAMEEDGDPESEMFVALSFVVGCAKDAVHLREARAAQEAEAAAKAADAVVVEADQSLDQSDASEAEEGESASESEDEADDGVVDSALMKLLADNELDHLETFLAEGKLGYDALFEASQKSAKAFKAKLERAGIEDEDDLKAMRALFKKNHWELCSLCKKGEFRKSDDVFMCQKCVGKDNKAAGKKKGGNLKKK
jgi:hypothetical protein